MNPCLASPPSGNNFPELPCHLQPLHHQVAGHVYDKKRAKFGFLECGDDTILKPLQGLGRGESELGLYQRVSDPACTNPTLLQLRLLIPRYLGTTVLPQHPNVTFLHLEDMTAGFVRPCIADVKLGRRTYDPLAGPEKMAVEDAKYPPAKVLGFQFRGMRAYDDTSDTFTKTSKELRRFNEDTIEEAFMTFFSNSGGLRCDAVAACLEELRPMHTWFQHQTELSFYASSVLMIYEGSLDSKAPSPCSVNPDSTPTNGDHPQATLMNGAPTDTPNEQPSNPILLNGPHPDRTITNDDHSDTTPLIGNISNDTEADSSQNSRQKNSHASTPPTSETVGDRTTGLTSTTSSVPGSEKHTCRAKVRLIDFAHVYPVDHVDENNLHGLSTLVRLLEGLLNK